MASKHLMAALLGTALLSAPALAQTQSPAPAGHPERRVVHHVCRQLDDPGAVRANGKPPRSKA